MTPAQAEAFWFFPEAEDPPPGPATDAMIAAFEADHGIILPPSFILLYQCQNGGFSRTHYDSFWSIGAAVTPLTTLDRLCDGYHDDNLVAAWSTTAGDLSRLVIFFGDGHFYFALNGNDLSDGEPGVWYLDDNGAKRTGMKFEKWLTSDGGAV